MDSDGHSGELHVQLTKGRGREAFPLKNGGKRKPRTKREKQNKRENKSKKGGKKRLSTITSA